MGTYSKLFLIIGIVAVAFWLYRGVRANPKAFSKANMGKSFFTMGVLAIVLIAVVLICIWLLKAGV